jgi:hypothetical protein
LFVSLLFNAAPSRRYSLKLYPLEQLPLRLCHLTLGL